MRHTQAPRYAAGFVAAGAGVVMALTATAAAAEPIGGAPPDGRIGYALYSLWWAIYQSEDGRTDCPNGYNIGPREQFAALFPPGGPAPTVEEGQLALEIQTWWPDTEPDGFPYHYPALKVGYGLDLDGEVGPEDYVTPDGVEGVDNELYRVLGCNQGFRGPDGVEFIFENSKAIPDLQYDRLLIELSGVDSLTDDPSVEVTFYRGLDRLMTDASGESFVPGGTQRIDMRWGRPLIYHLAGRIEDGVLTTDPIPEMVLAWQNIGVPTTQVIKDMRLQLNVSSGYAEGLIGGYIDIDIYHRQLMRNSFTHHLSNGFTSGISLYKELRKHADAYPDPETGENTAISGAIEAKFVQVHIIPPAETETETADLRTAPQQQRMASADGQR